MLHVFTAEFACSNLKQVDCKLKAQTCHDVLMMCHDDMMCSLTVAWSAFLIHLVL